MNLMREIRIENVTLNIGTGEAGNKLDKAVRLLKVLTNQKPIETKSNRRIPTWGLRPGLTIGTKVTIRKNTEEVLVGMFKAIGNELNLKKVGNGTFSFGIPEYIDIPGVKYDIDIGIIGLGVMVNLQRAGFRIKRRALMKRKIPKQHQITKEETVEYLKSKFNIKITDQNDSEKLY